MHHIYSGSELFDLIKSYDNASVWSNDNEFTFMNVNIKTDAIKHVEEKRLSHLVFSFKEGDAGIYICISGTEFHCDLENPLTARDGSDRLIDELDVSVTSEVCSEPIRLRLYKKL